MPKLDANRVLVAMYTWSCLLTVLLWAPGGNNINLNLRIFRIEMPRSRVKKKGKEHKWRFLEEPVQSAGGQYNSPEQGRLRKLTSTMVGYCWSPE